MIYVCIPIPSGSLKYDVSLNDEFRKCLNSGNMKIEEVDNTAFKYS